MRATFHYDLESPYAWLAAERIDSLLDVEWVPVLVGAIFKAAGRESWGLGDGRAAGIAEVERRAAERGLPPLRWPEPWPGNSLAAMRAAIRGGKPFALAAYRLHFTEGRLLDEDGIAAAAMAAGLDPDELVAATQDPGVKAELRANTEGAIARGVFGVPTVVVGDELYWGDDRLDEAAAGA